MVCIHLCTHNTTPYSSTDHSCSRGEPSCFCPEYGHRFNSALAAYIQWSHFKSFLYFESFYWSKEHIPYCSKREDTSGNTNLFQEERNVLTIWYNLWHNTTFLAHQISPRLTSQSRNLTCTLFWAWKTHRKENFALSVLLQVAREENF